MSLTQLSARYLPAIEAELRRHVGTGSAELETYYAMLTYHMGWDDETQPAGKRLRPLLCLLVAEATGGTWERALPAAAAIELIHNFSLIHDDIQDNSPLRRGRPTLWQRWGTAQAINAGDAMFVMAHLALQSLPARGVPAELALATLNALDTTCLALTQGQYLDMSFETRPVVTTAEYLQMIGGKTAALLAASAWLGALLGGANETARVHWRDYGRALGLAFQIHDDWLGIWGDPALTGKSTASDLEKRKKSLPVVYGLERSPEFASAYANPATPVADLTAQLTALGADDYTRALAAEQTDLAMYYLATAQPAGAAGAALHELSEQLLRRAA